MRERFVVAFEKDYVTGEDVFVGMSARVADVRDPDFVEPICLDVFASRDKQTVKLGR